MLSTRPWAPTTAEPILVAAVFRAFLLIYRARTADLFRIATQGTGKLPEEKSIPTSRRGWPRRQPLRRPSASDVHSGDRLLPAG